MGWQHATLHLGPAQQTLPNLLKSGFTPTAAALDRLLSFLAQSERVQTLFFVASQMIPNEFAPTPIALSIVSDSVLQCSQSHCYNQSRVFPMFTQKDGFFDYAIQHVCKVERNPDKAWSLLHCLNKPYNGTSFSPSLFSLYALIRCFKDAGMMDKSREMFDLMIYRSGSGVVNSFVCSCIVSGLSSIGEDDMALEFFSSVTRDVCFKPNLVAYTTVLNALCKSGRLDEVGDMVVKMEVEGLVLDEVFYSSWICGLVREGCLMEALKKHREMTGNGIKPDVVSYTVLIDGLCKEGFVEKVIGLLTEMNKQGSKPNLATYTAVIRGLVKKGQIAKALLMFHEVKDTGIELDEVVYGTLIDGLCKEGDIDSAFCLLGQMTKIIVPSHVCYNTIIDGLCKFGRTIDADHLSKTISCDKFTYTALLQGYIKEGNIVGARDVIKKVDSSGVHVDSTLRNIWIKALFKVGAFEDAYQLFKKMTEMHLVANVITYCTVIDWCCKVGQTDRILEILDDYKRNSFVCSNVAGYNCIIRSLCKVGMIEMAGKLFIELKESGLSFDSAMWMKVIEATFISDGEEGVLEFLSGAESCEPQLLCEIYNGVVVFFCQKGCYRTALELCNFMRNEGVDVTNRSYKYLLQGLIREGNTELFELSLHAFLEEKYHFDPGICQMLVNYTSKRDAKHLFRFVKIILKTGKKVRWSVERTLSMAIIYALMEEGRYHDAYKLVLELNDKEIYLTDCTYSVIIYRLCREGSIEKALNLCSQMKAKNFKPSIFTYNIVINGLCQQGCLLEAFRLFDLLEKVEVFPTIVTYSTLLNALCKEGLLDDAMKLFSRMILQGLSPTIQVYNILISGYCRFGCLGEALRLVLELENNNLSPDSLTTSYIISGYCSKADTDSALKFFKKWKDKGYLPDYIGFLSLVRGLCFMGRMEEARDVIREMLQTQATLDLIDKAGNQKKDSLSSFISSLCDQGRIFEAFKVLGKVGSILFPCSIDNGKLPERLPLDYEGIQSQTSGEDYGVTLMNDNSGSGHSSIDFDSWYDGILTFCSRGELQKANSMAKEMILNFP